MATIKMINKTPSLTGETILLRPLEENDVNFLFQLRSNEEVNRHLERKPAKDLSDVISFIQLIQKNVMAGESFYWIIENKELSVPAGTICLWNFNRQQKSAELGYELLPMFQGKGIMKQALKLVIDYAFLQMDFKMLIAYSAVNNTKSAALLQKMRFLQQDSDVEAHHLYTLSKV
jgi:ribosomal-protein-alanine N-acetyltransferase